MRRLIEISRKKARLVVGLMSGTSHDGVDAAIARITGSGGRCRVELSGHSRLAYPKRLREEVSRAMGGGMTELICRLNFTLGEFFAKAALKAISEAGLRPEEVDLIGSHGQTIYHIPPFDKGGAGGISNPPQSPVDKGGSTLQIGEGAVIAKRTGVVTVSDFRTADMAAGGQGAPLVPYADWVLFHGRQTVAIQNIGGISNVTVVTEDKDGVTGFDTGPGCSLIDEAVKILTGGRKNYDKDGRWAGSGKVIPGLLKGLLKNSYFDKRPPKSTGRELFGREMAEKAVKKYPDAKKEDILCTLTHLTARSIAEAYEKFVFPLHRPERIILAGGGARNGFLVGLIKEYANKPVILMDDLGIPAEAREALCFAVLANETISGNPGSLPRVTGAREPSLLGKISLV